MKRITLAGFALALFAGGCKKPAPPPLYEAVPVAHRDIVVSAEAAGAVEPILIVDVKSRASGTILQMRAQTGDHVRLGDTLVLVDRRDPTNTLNQAQADLEVARAQLANAESQKRRTDQMFTQQLVSEQEHEAANLTYANARAAQVRAETQVQTARDALDDTNVRAPITGTILAKNVEVGNVIASATRDVTGGVVLLRMADLSEVQVRTLVDETDIGKIQPGLIARITVDAYPNRPFQGTVLKIEPQSTTNQNVTMFPVLIRIANEDELLKPGMNAEVQIQVASSPNVLAIPNAALRTQRDVGSAAQVLGLNPADVQRTLAQADSQAGRGGNQLAGGSQPRQGETAGSMGGRTPPTDVAGARRTPGAGNPAQAPQAERPTAISQAPATPAPAAQPGQMGGQPGQGQRPPLPEGVTEEQWNAIRTKRRNQEPLTPAESTIAARVRENFQRMGGFGGPGGGGRRMGDSTAAGATGQPPTANPGGAAAGQDAGGFRMPAGFTMEQMAPIFAKARAQQPLTPQEQALMTRFRASMGGGGGGGGGNGTRPRANNNFLFGGSYIVFVLRDGKPTPVRIRTGVTDLDYSEVKSGLTDRDTVLLLPSASLVQSQQDMKDRFQRMTGGGGVPGMQQQTPRPTTGAAPGGGRN
jgi:HlyD family secretion protein